MIHLVCSQGNLNKIITSHQKTSIKIIKNSIVDVKLKLCGAIGNVKNAQHNCAFFMANEEEVW